jgi:hypothetical protein
LGLSLRMAHAVNVVASSAMHANRMAAGRRRRTRVVEIALT